MDTKLNNELTLSVPDGFRVMSEEELKPLQQPFGAPGWAVSDPDRHIILSIGWKKANALALRFLNAKDLAKNAEKALREPMRQYGYQLDEFESRDLSCVDACGFNYHYEVGDVGMSGRSFAAKKGSTVYYIHFYYRTVLQEESRPVIDGILESFGWG